MRSNLLVAFFIALVSTALAQIKINSPYSRFGIGDLNESGLAINRGMGGIGASHGGIFNINKMNPAMLQRNKYTVYEAGLQHTTRSLSSNSGNSTTADANIDYLALSLPMKRWNLGFGLDRLSQVNYDITSSNAINGTDFVRNTYKGSGGINKFYITNAYRVYQDTTSGTTLSLGLEYSYNFGQIELQQSTQLYEGDTTNAEIITYRQDNSFAKARIKPGIAFRKELLYYTSVKRTVDELGKDTVLFNKSYSFKDIKDQATQDAIVGKSMIIFPDRQGVLLDKNIKKDEDIDRLLDFFRILAGNKYGIYVRKEARQFTNKELRTQFIGLTDQTLAEDSITSNVIDYTSKFVRKHSGIYLNAGLAYDFKATLPGSALNIIERTTTSGSYISLDTTSNGDPISVTLPSSILFGFSVDKSEPKGKSRPSTWGLGVDLLLTNWSDYEDETSNDDFNNTYRVAVGGEYTPDPLLLHKKSYFRRVTYRAGFHYATLPYKINNTAINDIGINFGLSLPVGVFTMSTPPKYVNLSLSLGQRGTTSNNLVKEKYAILSMSFNFNSRWFRRYKLGL